MLLRLCCASSTLSKVGVGFGWALVPTDPPQAATKESTATYTKAERLVIPEGRSHYALFERGMPADLGRPKAR